MITKLTEAYKFDELEFSDEENVCMAVTAYDEKPYILTVATFKESHHDSAEVFGLTIDDAEQLYETLGKILGK